MKFIDQVTITVEAGNGGPGSSHFRREKFVPFGGPDGGDGGKGGSVILKGDHGKGTLLDLTFTPRLAAQHGQAGGGKNKSGKMGNDKIILVPLGTQAFNVEPVNLIADIVRHGQEITIAKGGRGGKGNAFFKTATNQAPTHSQPGEPGETYQILMSLKLIADIGLVGFPNAGKSTFLSRISKARPKIADYPFTTLTPQLGVASPRPGSSFVVADIPGLIEGASQGKGLGTDFLKHIERTKALFHLVDVTDGYNKETDEFDTAHLSLRISQIRKELSQFSHLLASLPFIIGLSKIDALSNRELLDSIIEALTVFHVPVLFFSSATGENIDSCLIELESLIRSTSDPLGQGQETPY